MRAGLVGYSQSGKTTLFNALTGQSAQTGSGGKADKPNLGVVKVPDVRIDQLSAIFKPKRTVYAEVLFVDVPGPRGKGGGFDSGVLNALREVDALIVVLRAFPGFDGAPPDPTRELRDFQSELILNDLAMVERRLERLQKDPTKAAEKAVLERCMDVLNESKPLRKAGLLPEDLKEVSSFAFLSIRPVLAALNVGENEAAAASPASLSTLCDESGVGLMTVSAALEAEIASLPKQEQGEFLASMGLDEPASARLIHAAYALLDYVSFFTVGDDEVRAWPVQRGSKAPHAAGKVHSDIERGFIRAEVMKYGEFLDVRNEAKMKELGKFRVEGKEYVIDDGDIVNFRFNV